MGAQTVQGREEKGEMIDVTQCCPPVKVQLRRHYGIAIMTHHSAPSLVLDVAPVCRSIIPTPFPLPFAAVDPRQSAATKAVCGWNVLFWRRGQLRLGARPLDHTIQLVALTSKYAVTDIGTIEAVLMYNSALPTQEISLQVHLFTSLDPHWCLSWLGFSPCEKRWAKFSTETTLPSSFSLKIEAYKQCALLCIHYACCAHFRAMERLWCAHQNELFGTVQ